MSGRTSFGRIFSIGCLILGTLLLVLNVYGLSQPLRKPGLGVDDHGNLRFIPDEIWDYRTSLAAIESLSTSDDLQALAEHANMVVHKSLIHVKWPEVDPVAYRQLIPPWENYFLWAFGKFSGLPQFERYHYTDYRRSIERGIGICGDASMALSSVLGRYGVESDIISFRGHVIVEYQDKDGNRLLLDPDFGVHLDRSLNSLQKAPAQVSDIYLAAGYSRSDVADLVSVYAGDFSIFDNTYDFMAKRYMFERAAYILKWVLPLLLIGVAVLCWVRYLRRTAGE